MAAPAHDVAALSIKGAAPPRFAQPPRRPADDVVVAVVTVVASVVNRYLHGIGGAGEIVELPSLGSCFDSVEMGSDFVYVDNAAIEGWLDRPTPWSGGAAPRRSRSSLCYRV
ncbi:hypothetical protein SASPL_108704 [Salvia splendens]|uniref:EREBP-like factor n=1 Tax=Salvia splendens TaxID=180675 RepID=A0A8X9A6F7_SALSN|nr:hypothetical protein SASPL_108704 [Salvia splendens]